jgi:hypothetical protein
MSIRITREILQGKAAKAIAGLIVAIDEFVETIGENATVIHGEERWKGLQERAVRHAEQTSQLEVLMLDPLQQSVVFFARLNRTRDLLARMAADRLFINDED